MRDVTDVLLAIYEFGRAEATTEEIREVIAWLRCELDDRHAAAKANESHDVGLPYAVSQTKRHPTPRA